MKRILTVLFALIFVFTLSAFSVSAEGESYDIIKESLVWNSIPNGGATCTITWEDGNAVIGGSTSGTWPQIYTRYENEDIIKVPVSDYSLVYDFTVESGYTNFSFYFNTVAYTMANTAFYEDQSGRVDYNTGSGDIGPGVYQGAITLTELSESTTLYGNTPFSPYVIRNGILEFHGIEFFSVDGGIVTVRELKLVPTAEVVEGEDPVVSDEPSEDPVVSDEPSEAPIESENEAPTVDNDTDNDDDATASTDATVDEAEEEDNSLIIWIIVGVVALAVIATVVVVVVKKKK